MKKVESIKWTPEAVYVSEMIAPDYVLLSNLRNYSGVLQRVIKKSWISGRQKSLDVTEKNILCLVGSEHLSCKKDEKYLYNCFSLFGGNSWLILSSKFMIMCRARLPRNIKQVGISEAQRFVYKGFMLTLCKKLSMHVSPLVFR